MAESIEEIRARLEDDPQHAILHRMEDGQRIELTAAERDEMLDAWAVNEHQGQLDLEEADAEEARNEQARALYDSLKAGTATNRQVQGVVAFLMRREFRELEP